MSFIKCFIGMKKYVSFKSCSVMQMFYDDKSNKNLFKIECRFNLLKKNYYFMRNFCDDIF